MQSVSSTFHSKLFDESTFYRQFLADIAGCQEEIIIESPFITSERTRVFMPIFEMLLKKGVKIYIFTRDPKEHELSLEVQSEAEIQRFEAMGIQVLLCVGNHHRKLAILDRSILWEGSLNILSQKYSREIMRRIQEKEWALEMFNFLKLQKFL